MDHGMSVLTISFQGGEHVRKVGRDMAEMLPHHPIHPFRDGGGEERM